MTDTATDTAKKSKGGRPTKYRPEFCQRVEGLGREGCSRAEIARDLDISFQTLRTWEMTHPRFLEATTRARELALGWWEAQGRNGIWSREFNATAYSLQVRNRFRQEWTDSQRLEHTIEPGDLSDDELRKRTAELRNRLLALSPSGNGQK